MSEKTASALTRIYEEKCPQASDLEYLLSLTDERSLKQIFSFADDVRRQYAGQGILLRGIIAFSNFCRNRCSYCGLNSSNSRLPRYRLSQRQILQSALDIAAAGIKTIVLQSGEDQGLQSDWLAEVISAIKASSEVAVTLSVGERRLDEYKLWQEAGADRYLLKIETADAGLYQSLHPGMDLTQRIECLNNLRDLGYQTGSGIIVGLPRQTLGMIARDIIFLKLRALDMIGIGPFIPHPRTPLGKTMQGDLGLTLKAIALTRIVTKDAHMPSTSALGSIGSFDMRKEGLAAGANVIMLDFTPLPYKHWYELYPGKRCIRESTGGYAEFLECLARSLERPIDYSRGDPAHPSLFQSRGTPRKRGSHRAGLPALFKFSGTAF